MSDYFAFSSIDDAISKTKALLWPFNWSIWLRIAIISFFVGGISGINPFQFTSPSGNGSIDSAGINEIMNIMPIIIAITALIIFLALIFGYLSSVFQFVFVDCLSKEEFTLRKFFRQELGRGARLFAFQILLAIAFVAIIIIAGLLMFAGISGFGDIPNTAILGAIISVFLLVFLLSIPVLIVTLFTIDFVVPIMIRENCGIIEGWKHCWSVMKKDWWQTIVYLVMKIILSIVVMLLMFIAIMIAALIIAIPFFILALLALGFAAGEAAFVLLLIVFIILLIPVALLMSVPFATFLKYYSLDVLGKMEPNYKMIE
ncbi:DUF4013 domain-containing protein [Methanoplanus sp. FWC-SCC4]|uniref:DUF4013 domain-containing protein n=1 Tax=Methanochimaera problematica TaxID=2609417 RepID=A0AA97FAU9_9EURY|nr:DUF4013 domain-containing protein [Methanoplanus sp. FWC-SCC4]WOF15727.1 DUF4013 domain-containing protein [Methanoplanus sp. FWC-SCC4]